MLSKIKTTLFLSITASIGYLSFWGYKNYILPAQEEKYLKEAAKNIVRKLELPTLLGQMFLVYFSEDRYEHLFKIKPGVLFLQRDSIPQKKVNSKNGAVQDIDLLKQKIRKIKQRFVERKIPPPFISVDQEYGRVQRIVSGVTDFPSPMAMGAAAHSLNDFGILRWVGFHSCSELREIGIDWPLTPLADVQTNRSNPVIGTRSFHSEPEIVSKAVFHYSQGLHEAGCMDTLKHFPGHGDTSLDSHKNIPIIQKEMNALVKQELLPFSENADTSYSIMLSHILLPKIDHEITSASSFWVQDHLRQKMKFGGLILTDDLGMKAVTPELNKKNIIKTALKSFKSGVDILLFSNGPDRFALDVYLKLLEKFSSKEIKKERILSSVEKIIFFKLKLGLYDPYLDRSNKKVLDYREKQNKRRSYLEREAPPAKSLNQQISESGIQILMGNIKDKNKNGKDPILFTDSKLNEFENQPMLQKKFSSTYHAFAELLDRDIQKPSHDIVILHSKNRALPKEIKQFLLLKERPKVTLLTVADPFPYSNLGIYFREGDRFITSFSSSENSRRALRRSLFALDTLKGSFINY